MMSRIRNAYESRFRKLLEQVRARQKIKGVDWLMSRSHKLSEQEKIPLPIAIARVHEITRRKIGRWQFHTGQPPVSRLRLSPEKTRFWCDSGLGGLARWLRALGYETFWRYHISDEELIRLAQQDHAILLTTDSMLMERRVIRDGEIPALWLPPTLYLPEQLEFVFEEFDLEIKPSRCMSCGGELRVVNKESLREKIPPKTYCWLNEFFICQRCGKLFWHGTHWEKIKARLAKVAA
jgi:uncharacterized protein with PIN domain